MPRLQLVAGEITCVLFLPQNCGCALMTADAEGYVYFWPVGGMANVQFQYKLYLQWSSSAHPITCMSYRDETKHLYVGDEKVRSQSPWLRYTQVMGWYLKSLFSARLVERQINNHTRVVGSVSYVAGLRLGELFVVGQGGW